MPTSLAGALWSAVGQCGGLCRSGRDRQNRAGLPGQQSLALRCERLEDRGVVLAQVRPGPVPAQRGEAGTHSTPQPSTAR
ncbi:hypothetical protein F8144_28530 [Streptomyces triticiradicis]|uniref:Uncharacterized protein n=1 Tax=Streptomyces triticiradicis TaxID=2651189 RepID=A0A7J5D925_9ACTN|nr:hypothetical protein F8144_28530 [Streptomyces triticiradicis]